MIDLELCAFCGGKAVHTMRFHKSPKCHRFECEYRFDGCPMNARTHHHKTIKDAAIAWNIRVP